MNGLYDELLVALHSVWKRRWLALGVGWSIALVGWLAVSLVPNKYESEARVLIDGRSMLSNTVGLTSADRQQGIDSVRQTLTSTVTLEKVVRGTGLAAHVVTDRDVTERAVDLAKAIKVVAEQDNLFRITATSGETSLSDAENAKLAREIVTKLTDLFVEGNVAGNRAETSDTLTFLNAQLDLRARQLAEADARRGAFEEKYMSLLPGVGTIADRIAAARMEMARLDTDLAAAQSGVAAVRAQMSSTPAATRTPGGVIAGSSGGIQAQIAEGRARGWTDQHPDMVALRDQLARGGAAAGPRMSAPVVTSNPMYVSLRSMLAEKQAVLGALASRRQQIQGQINTVIAQQQSNPQVAAEQTQLDRNYQVLKSQYDKLLSDREDVKLRGDVQARTDAIKFSVIDPPSAPRVPAAPNRPLLLTMVLLAAVAAGTGAAFAVGQVQGSFATPGRLSKASGLPVLGSIHEVLTDEQRVEGDRKRRLFAGGAAALAGVYALLMVVEFVQRSTVA